MDQHLEYRKKERKKERLAYITSICNKIEIDYQVEQILHIDICIRNAIIGYIFQI